MKTIQVVSYGMVLLVMLMVPGEASAQAFSGKQFTMNAVGTLGTREYSAEFREGYKVREWFGQLANLNFTETASSANFGSIYLSGFLMSPEPFGSRFGFPVIMVTQSYAWFDSLSWHLAGAGFYFFPFLGAGAYVFTGDEILPPLNDNFATRFVVFEPLPFSILSTTAASGVEVGEPLHAGVPAAESVWWSWTAPQSARIEIHTGQNRDDTLLAVYTGTSLEALTHVASDQSSINDRSLVRFHAQAGTTYQVAVAKETKNLLPGRRDIFLHVALSPPAPVNDLFVDRIELNGLPAMGVGTTIGATAEPGEVGQSSVWWSWTSPTTECIEINTLNRNRTTILAVFSGSSIDALSLVAWQSSSRARLRFDAQAGTTYQISVDDGRFASEGPVELNVLACPPAVP